MNKKIAIILLLLLAVTFIPSFPTIDNSLVLADRPRAEGYIAFVVHDKEVSETHKDEVVKCTCGGGGVMIHGDGHKTPCPCKATGECKCGKEVAPSPPEPPKVVKPGLDRKVVLLFTADWCGPCQAFKKQFPQMKQKNLTYSDIDDKFETKMEIVDVDKDSTLYDKLKGDRKLIPLFIFLDENNNEVGHFVGNQDYGTIIRRWNEY